jgi:ribosomal protein S18 acetylase RimI-like enzyme
MSFIIRPFTESDYEGYALALSAATEEPVSPDRLRWTDGHLDPKIKFQRWVASVDGLIVGGAEYYQRVRAYHPQRFHMSLGVHPDYRRRGIGSALYAELRAGLAQHQPISLIGRAREDWPDSIAQLERHDFVELSRIWESRLDLTRWEPPVAVQLPGGYRILNLTEVQAMKGWAERLFDLMTTLRWDVPSDEPRTATPFEEWMAALSGPITWPEGFLIAALRDQLVGISEIRRGDGEGALNIGLTGVLREHRGKGIATALKVRGLQVAKAAA